MRRGFAFGDSGDPESAALAKVFYSDDGSTAMEVSLKLAYEFARRKRAIKRPRFLSLEGAYHGDTVGAAHRDIDAALVAVRAHLDRLNGRAASLNRHCLDALRFRGPGTDLTVGLFPMSRWMSAGGPTIFGQWHVANVPTEEVFTTPNPVRTTGFVRSTRPLIKRSTAAATARYVLPVPAGPSPNTSSFSRNAFI